MGLRFRRSISLWGGTRINLSKSWLWVSTWIKWLRVWVWSKWAYTSAGIPWTWLYSMNYMKNKKTATSDVDTGKLWIWCLTLIGLIILIANPPLGIFLFIVWWIIYYFWAKTPKNQIKNKLAKARIYFAKNDYENSITLLNEILIIDSNNLDVIYLLWSCYHNIGKYKEAIPYFEQVLLKNWEDLNSSMLLSNCYYQAKKYKEAILLLQKIPEDFEKYITVIQILWACFFAQKKYDLAIEVFKKAPLQKRSLDDDLMSVHYNLGLVYEESWDKKNALKHFKKVYAQNTEYRDVNNKINSLEK